MAVRATSRSLLACPKPEISVAILVNTIPEPQPLSPKLHGSDGQALREYSLRLHGDFVDRGSWSIEAGRGLAPSGLPSQSMAGDHVDLRSEAEGCGDLVHGTSISRCHSLSYFIQRNT